MSCPICHGKLKQLPAVYPTFWCESLGHLIQGSEEELERFTPLVVKRLAELGGECLRDDRQDCFAWRAIRDAIDQETKGLSS